MADVPSRNAVLLEWPTIALTLAIKGKDADGKAIETAWLFRLLEYINCWEWHWQHLKADLTIDLCRDVIAILKNFEAPDDAASSKDCIYNILWQVIIGKGDAYFIANTDDYAICTDISDDWHKRYGSKNAN